jgi:hypothetical protein
MNPHRYQAFIQVIIYDSLIRKTVSEPVSIGVPFDAPDDPRGLLVVEALHAAVDEAEKAAANVWGE